jgi:branched-chain amino acid transport system ATP-binding protein
MSLVLANLTKAYGGQRVVDQVSLTIPENGMTGIIGPNGAGKSTLFSLVTGFIDADSGSVRLGDHVLDRLPAHARAQAGMVRTFQVPREYSHLSVRENLAAAAPGQTGETLAGLFFRPALVRAEEKQLAERVAATLAFLRLDKVADQAAAGLSGGQKKLLELGRALMTGARLILLDEPFAGVNPVLIEQLSERIRELHARGTGFLIIEHDLGALSRLVSTMHVMDRGAVIASGTPAEVLASPAVREAYLGGKAQGSAA